MSDWIDQLRHKPLVISAVLLGVFTMICLGLVFIVFQTTQAKITENRQAAVSASLSELLAEQHYDNQIEKDVIIVADTAEAGFSGPLTVYRARKSDNTIAAVIAVTTNQGYNGAIALLVGINFDGTLTGVRVVSHRETPGLGDDIEVAHSPWILQFSGLSLKFPEPANWAVKRDGGTFDQFTGATITARAVVNTIYQTLVLFSENKVEWLARSE